MAATRRRPATTRRRWYALAVSYACVSLLTAPAPAGALDYTGTPAPVTGSATWFDALGDPYGGCGIPQKELDSPHFVALNVYNTPGDYVFYPRPLVGEDVPKIGMWNNGHNCGRWIKVTISDWCTGINDGVAGQPFCRNGEWIADDYNGATLNMLIGDSCGDSNAWCRDDPYHIDLAHASLNQFVKDGKAVGDMDPEHWGNRHVTWEFIEAPDYTGDIRLGFLAGSKPGWTALAVSHLRNGVHGMEYYKSGQWVDAPTDGDMGQAFLIEPLYDGEGDYEVRIRDVDDEYINDGRVYRVSLPESCGRECSAAYTEVEYETAEGPTVPEPSTCTATYATTKSWDGGYQGSVTVTAGVSPIKDWTVSWELAAGQTIGSSWNGVLTTSDSTVKVTNVAFNGALKAGATADFGFSGNGDPGTPEMTCTATAP